VLDNLYVHVVKAASRVQLVCVLADAVVNPYPFRQYIEAEQR